MEESSKYELSEKDYLCFEEELKKQVIEGEGTSFQPFYIKGLQQIFNIEKGVWEQSNSTIISIVDGAPVANYGIISMRALDIDDFLKGKDPIVGTINKFDGKYAVRAYLNRLIYN